jgi:hypothetical protein
LLTAGHILRSPCLPLCTQLHIYNGGTSYAARQQSWLQTYMGAGSYWPQPTQYPTINRGTRAVTPKIMVTVDRLVGAVLVLLMSAGGAGCFVICMPNKQQRVARMGPTQSQGWLAH